MRSASQTLKHLFVVLIIGTLISMIAGCGLHFGYGTKSSAKGKKASSLQAHEASMVLDDQYAHPAGLQNESNSGYLETAEPGQEWTGSEITGSEGIGGEDPFAQGWQPGDGGSSEDYWAQRQQAEFLTEQAGLQDVYFGFDSWELTDEAKQILKANAQWLKGHPKAAITIEGHCDQRGTRAYNYVLGEKRATRTRNYLASLGVSPTQLTVMSYGKDNPFCRESSNTCYQENRRAHMVLGTAVASSIQEETNTLESYD
ncbi:MAG: OmpA family protein [Nitrospirales bacterium]|nr:OmpA family protein [Nitrospirales bacterium]